MQIKKLIPSLMEQWKAIYETERPHLKPNAITGEALTRYIEDRFAVQPSEDESLQNAVRGMLAQSALVRQKVGDGDGSRRTDLCPGTGRIRSRKRAAHRRLDPLPQSVGAEGETETVGKEKEMNENKKRTGNGSLCGCFKINTCAFWRLLPSSYALRWAFRNAHVCGPPRGRRCERTFSSIS